MVKISLRWGKGEITFKAIEKYQYGLRKTVPKHLKSKNGRKKIINKRNGDLIAVYPDTVNFRLS